jgi:hypothetical protein
MEPALGVSPISPQDSKREPGQSAATAIDEQITAAIDSAEDRCEARMVGFRVSCVALRRVAALHAADKVVGCLLHHGFG